MPTSPKPRSGKSRTGVQPPSPGARLAEARVRAELDALSIPHNPLRGSEVEPMLAETAPAPFSRKGWLFELKIDGFRAIAGKQGDDCTLQYRRGRDAAAIYPDVMRALAALPVESLVLDGEIAVLDAQGLPSFQRLQGRALLTAPLDVAQAARDTPACYFAFDLLGFDDRDLRGLPLVERKRLLALLLPRSGVVRAVEHVEEHGVELFERSTAAGLEGVMGKRAAAPYANGRSADWLKIRALRTGDFAIVGFTEPKGGRSGFGALHLASATPSFTADTSALVYSGRVGTGFSEQLLRDLRARLEPLRIPLPPCAGPAPRGKGNVWVQPRYLCEVRYHQVTEEGLLRQPVFLRLRDDKAAADPAPIPPVAKASSAHSVKISNRRKLLWPADGMTKGDLVDYYQAIAPRILPYLRGRALTITRYPDGIEGKFFFQKNAPTHTPDWIRVERILQAGNGIDAIVCDDEATLLWCANLAAIPLHVSANPIQSERCDYCVIDLDPKSAPFKRVVQIARALRELCEAIGMPSFIKTSGQKGLHVLLPLGGACTHEQSRALAEVIARCIEARLPEIATTERIIEARKGRVYLDYLQNGDGKTVVAAWSARPVAGATVSMPLAWSEVDETLDPKEFSLRTAISRAESLGEDPCLAALTLKPDLPGILARLNSAGRPERAPRSSRPD